MIYSEDDWVAEVEVLADTSTPDWKRYELKVIRTIRKSNIYRETPDGHVFKVDKHISVSGIWSLGEEV